MLTANTTTVQGVFMNVEGEGVLLTGESGIGKSELALNLIERKHALIADDVIEFAKVNNGTIYGQCPELLQDFLAVKNLGVLNIRLLFGRYAISKSQKLSLIIHLTKSAPDFNDLIMPHLSQDILGNIITKFILTTGNRNLALLVEVIVRNFKLKMQGYEAGTAFIQKQEAKLRISSL